MRFLNAEFKNVFSTKGWLFCVLAAVLLPTMGSVTQGVMIGKEGGLPSSPDAVLNLMGNGFTGGLVSMILGIIIVTNEFRYSTIAQSVIDSGSRLSWLLTKLVPILVLGLAITTISEISAIVSSLPFLSSLGANISDLGSSDLLHMVGGTMLLGIPSSLIGAALGLLIRNQMATVVSIILYQMFAEAALLEFFPRQARFLPGAAQAALTNDPNLSYHNVPLAFAVYGGWIAILGAIAIVTLRRRDIVV